MSLENRVEALEKEVAIIREEPREQVRKLEELRVGMVGLPSDLAELERKVDRGFERIDRSFDELPDMIARIVGEALRAQGRS